MSSDIQTALEPLVLYNYTTLIVVTAVIYDYILTLSREIEHVWCRPWTWVSTMFVVVRYIGLCWVMTFVLFCTTFIPGPLECSNRCKLSVHDFETRRGYFKGSVIYRISGWAFVAFLSAADLVMILRVYAMWNRSKTILCILLFIYVLQTIVSIVLNGIINNPNTHLSVTVVQVLDFSFCNSSFISVPPTLRVYLSAPRLVLSAALIIFAALQILKQSFQMYRATKQWQPNRYMQQLVRDGILYFLVHALYQAYTVFGLGAVVTFNAQLILGTFVVIIFYVLVPRFIIGVRELYHRDIRGRSHIDTGFGVQSRSSAGPDATVSAIMFVDGNRDADGGTNSSGDLETGPSVHGSGSDEVASSGGMD